MCKENKQLFKLEIYTKLNFFVHVILIQLCCPRNTTLTSGRYVLFLVCSGEAASTQLMGKQVTV